MFIWRMIQKQTNKNCKIPKFNKKTLDIIHLCFQVASRGGFEAVSKVHGAWRKIYKTLPNFSIKTTNSTARLKRYYVSLGLIDLEFYVERYLAPVEKCEFDFDAVFDIEMIDIEESIPEPCYVFSDSMSSLS